jgi:hypothetical protein
MPKEYIFKLTLEICNPDLPFNTIASFGESSGNINIIFDRFKVLERDARRWLGDDMPRMKSTPFHSCDKVPDKNKIYMIASKFGAECPFCGEKINA